MAASAVDNQLELVAMPRKSLGQKQYKQGCPVQELPARSSGGPKRQLWKQICLQYSRSAVASTSVSSSSQGGRPAIPSRLAVGGRGWGRMEKESSGENRTELMVQSPFI